MTALTATATGVAPEPGPPAVTIRGLGKRFGSTVAVQGLDLDVATGSLVGLIGPNGAGKTTTMRVLAGLTSADAGTVAVFGLDPLRHPGAVRRRVGWMPDFFGVYDGLTVHEYLDFFAAAYRVQAAERPGRIGELLDLVRLGDKRDTDVHGLSRGMQQRLGLARALVHGPDLLLLDEPASGLDPRARVELREILLALAAQGTTILLSSHILAELAEVCDSVAIVDAGRVVAAGSVAQLAGEGAQGAIEVSVRLAIAEQGPEVAERAEQAGAAVVGIDTDTVHLRLTGGDDEVADLVRHLVLAGAAIAEIAQRRAGLEQLFLQLTAPPAPPASPATPPTPAAPLAPAPPPGARWDPPGGRG